MSRPVRAPSAFRAALAVGVAACVTALLLLVPPRSGASTAVTEGGAQPVPSGTRYGVLDQGRFVISQSGKAVRVEDFTFERTPDTLTVRATSMVALPGRPERPPDKSMILVVGPLDFAMGDYWSRFISGPDTLRRGVEVTPGDTAFTVWREFNESGTGDRLALPPGRMYILDPPLFTTFDFIGRTLQGKVCDHRPIKVFVLGGRDSLVDATVTDVGNETIRWGARPVEARKLVIADEQTSFTAWFSPDGRMLRLEQPKAGVRVDRKAPALKRRTPR